MNALRFARLKWTPEIKEYEDAENAYCNLGDIFQCISIEKLYRSIGIEDSLIEIGLHELKTYEGPDCILPLHIGLNAGNIQSFFPVSSHIRPVFFAVTIIIDLFEQFPEYIPYFKQYEPIGARDEKTLDILTRHGIQSYLVGCTTFILQSDAKEQNRNRYYLVDIPEKLRFFLPSQIADNAAEVRHEVPILKYPMDDSEYNRIYRLAEDYLKRYDTDAKCIITTRLHGIIPALTMGIPVVAVSNNIDYRFSFIDKFLPIYTPEQFDEIDWDPPVPDTGEARNLLIRSFEEMILSKDPDYPACRQSTTFWLNRSRADYNSYLRKTLNTVKEVFPQKFCYGIWGAGIHGFLAYEMMQEMFPEASLSCLIDKYERGKLFGKDIVGKEHLEDYICDCILVTTSIGLAEAEAFLKSLHREKNKDYFIFLSKEMKHSHENH